MAELTDEPFAVGQESQPKFLTSAEVQAAEAGMTVSTVLEDDLESLSDSPWPKNDCLYASEIQAYIQGERLDDDRVAHLKGCEFCSLVVGLRPGKGELLKVEVRSAAAI